MMRYRLLFALLGAVACMLAALLAEGIFACTDLSHTLDDRIGRVLVFRSDIVRRLENAGGKTGDVEIILSWNNHNDLDLQCADPRGYWIGFDHKHSPSDGTLDVDANAGPPYTNEPVENIYWPFGRAPKGHYTVRVHYYANHGSHDPTPYSVLIVERGHVYRFHSTIWPLDVQSVYGFDTNRSGVDWGNLIVSLLRAALVTGFWALLLATSLALALAGGQQRLWIRSYGQALMTAKRLRKIVLYGALAGLAAGVLGQLLFSLISFLYSESPVLAGRMPGWALLGLVIGGSLAQWMPNLPRYAATVAGLLAGAFGAWGFMALGVGSDLQGRLLAATVLGFVIGFLINLSIERLDELEQEYLETEPFTMQTYRLRAYRGASAGSLRGRHRG